MTTPADSRRFRLVRTTDVTGVSGTGHVADGVAFPDGTVALRWRSEWPTSLLPAAGATPNAGVPAAGEAEVTS